VFESLTQKELNVKSFSLKRRMTPVMLILMRVMNSEKKKENIFGIRYSKLKHAVAVAETSPVCVQRSAKK